MCIRDRVDGFQHHGDGMEIKATGLFQLKEAHGSQLGKIVYGDVYKRQAYGYDILAPQVGDARALGRDDSQRFCHIFGFHAVSYTHLDVYKRQAVGAVAVPLGDVWAALTGGDCPRATAKIILNIRLIKAVVALLAGAALSEIGRAHV